MSVYRQNLATQAEHHHALGSLHTDARKRCQVLEHRLVVGVGKIGEGDFTKVLDQLIRDMLYSVGALTRQSGIGHEQREIGHRRFCQALPLGQDSLYSVKNALVARAGRHLGQDDEDQLVEWVSLVVE